MSARVTWDGLAELREALRNLPEELAAEAGQIVEGAANEAADTVRSVYAAHRLTGHLADAVTVKPSAATSRYGVSIVVKNSDPIAWLFDNGSQARHWVSGKPTGTMWGRTPPTHAFVRSMIGARRTMYDALKAMLERHGLTVTGDA